MTIQEMCDEIREHIGDTTVLKIQDGSRDSIKIVKISATIARIEDLAKVKHLQSVATTHDGMGLVLLFNSDPKTHS